MKTMKNLSLLILVVTTGILSCKKDESPAPAPQPLVSKTVSDLVADTIIGIAPTGQPFGANKYTFYSLENNVDCTIV